MGNKSAKTPPSNQDNSRAHVPPSTQAIESTAAESEPQPSIYNRFRDSFRSPTKKELRKVIHYREITKNSNVYEPRNSRQAKSGMIIIGPDKCETNKETVIIVIGPSRSGKTTALNAIANYIFGVGYRDDYRIQVDRLGVQNSVTGFTFHYMKGMKTVYGRKDPYNLTIIDTPGFTGKASDERIRDDILDFISSGAVNHIDLILFTLASSTFSWEPQHKALFDCIRTSFNSIPQDNIAFLMTYADAGKPQAVSLLEKAKVLEEAPRYYAINNANLLTPGVTGDELDKFHWEERSKSFDSLFENLLPKLKPMHLPSKLEVTYL